MTYCDLQNLADFTKKVGFPKINGGTLQSFVNYGKPSGKL